MTPVLPTGALSPQASPSKVPPSPSKISPSPSKGFSMLTLGRKLPITIHHKEKTMHFTFPDTKTLKELFEEIKRLSKCSGGIFVSSIRRDISDTVVLKTLDLPSVNKVTMKCDDPVCHQQFNNQMMVTGLSTEEMYLSAKETINDLTNRIEELEKDVEREKSAKIRYSTECHRLRYQLKMKNNTLGRVRIAPIPKKKKLEILTQYLSPFFTPAMINCFFRGTWKRVKNWSKDDIVMALTIRLLSRKTYILIRRRKLIPLPGLSTLKNYFKHFTLNQGFFAAVVPILSVYAAKLTPLQKIVGILFDEVNFFINERHLPKYCCWSCSWSWSY